MPSQILIFLLTYPLRESHPTVYLTIEVELSTTSYLKPLAGRTTNQGIIKSVLTKPAFASLYITPFSFYVNFFQKKATPQRSYMPRSSTYII